MHVLALSTLKAFWADHSRAEDDLRAWNTIVEKAEWQSPADVLTIYRDADVVSDNRIIFNIRHNEFRLVVHFKYRAQLAMVCFVGTHRQYDRINPETV